MTAPTLPLGGLGVERVAGDPAVDHAARLLADLGASVAGQAGAQPALHAGWAGQAGASTVLGDARRTATGDWAASGAMGLTGLAAGPPLAAPGAPATAARGALLAFELLSDLAGRRVALDGSCLLGERAAFLGLSRQGRRSPSGTLRLLPAGDGWVAVNLPRPSDVELVGALAGRPVDDPWPALAELAGRLGAAGLAERAQELGVAAAALVEPAAAAADAQSASRGQTFPLRPFVVGAPPPGRPAHAAPPAGAPLVVDLSALWAGPLCSHLLGLAGARVVKVESTTRPDGARLGPPGFFDLLHAGHRSVVVDLGTVEGRAALAALVRRADVVIEASRPRALTQLGIEPGAVLAERPRLTWVSITAYGRSGPWSQRVGFGDDAALAAGLVAFDARGDPVVCGDAIADPLAGAHAAVAALASVLGGGGHLVDVAMRDVVGAALADPRHQGPSGAAAPGAGGWEWVGPGGGRTPVAPPAARLGGGTARALGADTRAVLDELGRGW